MRLALARALFVKVLAPSKPIDLLTLTRTLQPDLLLLDEPSNHSTPSPLTVASNLGSPDIQSI